MTVQSIQIAECNRTTALAGALLDGELLPETVLVLERHIRGCSACRQAVADVSRLKTLLRTAVRTCSIPSDMKGHIRARLAESAPPWSS